MTPQQKQTAEQLHAKSFTKAAKKDADLAIHILNVEYHQGIKRVLIGLDSAEPREVLHNIMSQQPEVQWEVFILNGNGVVDAYPEYELEQINDQTDYGRIFIIQSGEDNNPSSIDQVITSIHDQKPNVRSLILAEQSLAQELFPIMESSTYCVTGV